MQEHFQNFLAPRQEPRPRKVRKTRRRNHAILFSVILAFFFLQSQGLSLKRKLLQTSSLTSVAAQEQRSPPGLFVKRKNCVCSPARQPFFRKSSASRPRAKGQGPLFFQAKTSLSVPDRRQTKNFSHRPQTGEKHHHFQFKGQLGGGKAEFLQCSRTESQRGLLFPGNSSPARVNNF
ncbi:hypothetical protein AVEN_142249-1 [Araneus ventricosus]|uniref:Uncharacterized protein n=1 Tax=Araneus ventricosus TaxID=182803 RepID=A0A4Y2FG83_ARAVE|nr:hypothetical protein AVEN_142249-1 [Araneus ventricosus]